MKFGFKRSLLVRATVALLAVAAPALSGCNKTDFAKEQQNRLNEYKIIDDGLIQQYLTRKGYTEGTGVNQYQRLNESANDGIYLVKLNDGPTGETIKSGQQADVKTIGRFLRESNENIIFDNSSDQRVPCGCYNITVGSGGFIRGVEQSLLQMKKGDRKLVLIPSYLAYGQAGRPSNSGPSIPGDEPLLFDVEVLDVR
ncbi:MAG TPA: FKBP-type peptidyl-prolyl cis-trans isomerase [Hymenobacter sp.]|nr:FKBP-type peptidyl-prolyl cis-trans isomerase [Hymenobacter sp.]